MRSIANLFAKSPFMAIRDHMDKTKECVDLIKPLFEALRSQKFAEVEKIAIYVSKLEHEADQIKQLIRDTLPKSIFMSVDRGDVLNLIKQQDAIADCAEDLAVILTMRKMELPEELWDQLLTLLDTCIRTFDTAFKVIEKLIEALESSLWGPAAEKVLSLIRDCGTREWESDQAQMELMKEIFKREEEIGPVSIFMWMKIIKKLGDIADYSQNTADRIRSFIAR